MIKTRPNSLLTITLRVLLGLGLLVGLSACPGGEGGDDDHEGGIGQRGDDDD